MAAGHHNTRFHGAPTRPGIAALLDLENLLYAERRISGAAVRSAFIDVVEVLHRLGDLRYAVACCDRWLAGILAPVSAAAGVRIHPCPIGKDCADVALLRRASDVPARVDTVVVGSGDAAFAPLVTAHAGVGRRTVVVGRRGTIAACLRCAADDVVELTRPARVSAAA